MTSLKELGFPPQKIKIFNKKGIQTPEDLLNYFPRRYYDFRHPQKVKELAEDKMAAVIGTIDRIYCSSKVLNVSILDADYNTLSVVWFNGLQYITHYLSKGKTYIFCGKISRNPQTSEYQMLSPYAFSSDLASLQRIIPVYSKIRGVSADWLEKMIVSALDHYIAKQSEDLWNQSLFSGFHLISKEQAYTQIHHPDSFDTLKKAKNRFLFEDFFYFYMQLMKKEKTASHISPYIAHSFKIVEQVLKELPYELTSDQRKVLREISQLMQSGRRVDALIQGDVGCGKTIVAIMMMLVMCENGYQTALMAPTNVLAKQHYLEMQKITASTPFKVVFLSGETSTKEKKLLLTEIKKGTAQIVVGTHAVIQKEVVFKNLALTIVDEEHRFGVKQRELLAQKAEMGVHNLSMSATPIPRSLAMILYGEQTKIFTIKELPKGRRPVKTIVYSSEEKCYLSILHQIEQGRQCYVVCPLIETSESEKLTDVDSVEKTLQKMTRWFSRYPSVKIASISGKMKDQDVEELLEQFKRNKIQILISTTIIEVGVNFPNASVMMIKNAERFGLAQLHQLRGRVGRGGYQSYCVLLSKDRSNPKLLAMAKTNDGFKIAEKDLQLRGMGDFIGIKQSGENKYVSLMLAFPKKAQQVKSLVQKIYNDSSLLKKYSSIIESN